MFDTSFLDGARFRPQTAEPLVFNGLAQVRAYWEGLRQGDSIPERAQLDPRGLGGVLDRVFLAEQIGPGLVQIRIAGSALAEIAGIDPKGLPLSCLFTAEARPKLAELVERVTTGAALCEVDLSTDRRATGTMARLLLLPLCDGADRKLLLGCLAFGKSGPEHCGKFVIQRVQEERIVVPPPEVAPTPEPRKPHLMLVHSRD